MAKIGVLDIHQLPTAKPQRYISKTIAELLTRRLLARRIAKHMIQMLPIHTFTDHPIFPPILAKPFIPDKMPPREIPNTFFQLPNSYTWKLHHRSVSFLPK